MKVPDDMSKMLQESGKGIAKLAASTSFEFWQRADFRLYVDFPNIGQTEQDRIFNELEVSVLGLFSLQFDALSKVPGKKESLVFKTLQKELIEGFMQMMEEVGIEKKFLKQWEMLIDMRLREYREDLKTALSESSLKKEFKGDEDMWQTWARIETITINCLSHIRRGEVKEEDPMWKLLRKWLITVDSILRPLIRNEEEKNASS